MENVKHGSLLESSMMNPPMYPLFSFSYYQHIANLISSIHLSIYSLTLDCIFKATPYISQSYIIKA